LSESITYECFDYVRKGLFENHKIIFSTLICMKILERDGKLKGEEIRHLIFGKILLNYPNVPETVKGYLTE
jgi:dynein heavy chain